MSNYQPLLDWLSKIGQHEASQTMMAIETLEAKVKQLQRDIAIVKRLNSWYADRNNSDDDEIVATQEGEIAMLKAKVELLTRERDQAEVRSIKWHREATELKTKLAEFSKLGTIEVMCLNPQVKEAIEHWEGRALKAEEQLESLQGVVKRECCGTFHGSRHRSTCHKYRGKEIK